MFSVASCCFYFLLFVARFCTKCQIYDYEARHVKMRLFEYYRRALSSCMEKKTRVTLGLVEIRIRDTPKSFERILLYYTQRLLSKILLENNWVLLEKLDRLVTADLLF